MKRITALILSVMLTAVIITGCGNGDYNMVLEGKYTSVADVPRADKNRADENYQSAQVQKGDVVAVLHTSMGDISMRFFPEIAPIAVNNFIALAKDGKYDNTIFHRVINNFMIQGGDYTNFDGTGGESIYGKEFALETVQNVSNTRGAVAMANRGPGTNGSQFYINQVDNTYLDGSYTVFAQVYDGMDVVDQIAAVETGYSDKPVTDVTIDSVEITKFKG